MYRAEEFAWNVKPKSREKPEKPPIADYWYAPPQNENNFTPRPSLKQNKQNGRFQSRGKTKFMI